jgi:hypothetical protein
MISIDVLKSLHVDCSLHRENVERSKLVGCFYCRSTFSPANIREWIDDGETALCPLCGIDAVLPDSVQFLDGLPNWGPLLDAMHAYWFVV